jgi:ATP-dependent DNA helicase RecQ
MPSQTTPLDLLQETFGHTSFRPGQEAVVDALLDGRSALAVFPTGGGKSLCYQLPALMLDGLTLVISPLIALMKDQVDALQARGVAAARLDGTLDYEEVQRLYQKLVDGQLKLLYVAPERLANEGFLGRLRQADIAMLAIDEAHCISEWGHNFRPDYLKLAQFAREHQIPRVLALTATATPAVSADIREAFGIEAADHVQTGFYRPNLELRITPCARDQRRGLLLERLQTETAGSAVVYVTLQRTAEEVAEYLVKHGVAARSYHAGLRKEERASIQEAFMSGASRVVVATIAFGMGIDKADIRAVYHYNLPKTLENYVQEVGRAGRDGLPARCEMFACADDAVVLGNFSYGDTPTPEAVSSLVDDLLGRGRHFSVSRYDLSHGHDVRDLVVATLLTYLELGGTITPTGPFYSGYKFKLFGTPEEAAHAFDPERRDFLMRLFDSAKKGRTWYTLDPTEAALTLREPRERVVAALGYLEEQQELELKPSGLRHGYTLERRPRDPEALCEELAARFQAGERRNTERLAGLVAFCEASGCVWADLVAYFGEHLDADCGHCGRCLGAESAPLPRSQPVELDQATRAVVTDIVAERHEALAAPRQLARFLCGLPSPATSRARLRGHARFGWLGPVPFPEVLALAEAALAP